ncbi:TetR-like C-terminal domain-containing protein [Lentzea sp. NPDC102401]|uniref:TetR-like C-terminal domain-containing protein n=1 Tax=Lentzea sp. NPDC102401 TaxID=3364128 RepID=UPI0038110806
MGLLAERAGVRTPRSTGTSSPWTPSAAAAPCRPNANSARWRPERPSAERVRTRPARRRRHRRGPCAAIHGFASLEGAGGFGLPRDVDRSYGVLIEVLIAGLRQRGTPPAGSLGTVLLLIEGFDLCLPAAPSSPRNCFLLAHEGHGHLTCRALLSSQRRGCRSSGR